MFAFIFVLVVCILIYLNCGFLLGIYVWNIAHQAPTNFSQTFFNWTLFSLKDPFKNYDLYDMKPSILVWSQGRYAGIMAFGWGPMIISHIILLVLLVAFTVFTDLGVLILNLITWPARKALKLNSIRFFNPFK
jgi:hypothetical protein